MSSAGGVADCIITHVVSGQQLKMPMVIVTYEAEAKPNWSSTAVYGRMDPIFTYQNTVRTFTVVLRTPKGGEKFTKAQAQVFLDANQVGWSAPTEIGGRYTAPTTVAAKYVTKIADLYKLMYPTYEDVSNRGTGFMTGAPLLRLSLEGVIQGSSAGSVSSGVGLLFVPETFKVTSLVDTAKPIVTISSAADLRFFANAGGYTITLGGTVLHEDARVGWVIGENKTVHFGQGNNFPYNTGDKTSLRSTGVRRRVRLEIEDEDIVRPGAQTPAEQRCYEETPAVDGLRTDELVLKLDACLDSLGD